MKLDDLEKTLMAPARVDREGYVLAHVNPDGPEAAAAIQLLRRARADLEALVGELGEALVTAMIPIEAVLLSGADAAHCQDVRDAMRDARTTARATLAKLEKARG